jgi:hypothetical protein
MEQIKEPQRYGKTKERERQGLIERPIRYIMLTTK